jgi:hypothetical protein
LARARRGQGPARTRCDRSGPPSCRSGHIRWVDPAPPPRAWTIFCSWVAIYSTSPAVFDLHTLRRLALDDLPDHVGRHAARHVRGEKSSAFSTGWLPQSRPWASVRRRCQVCLVRSWSPAASETFIATAGGRRERDGRPGSRSGRTLAWYAGQRYQPAGQGPRARARAGRGRGRRTRRKAAADTERLRRSSSGVAALPATSKPASVRPLRSRCRFTGARWFGRAVGQRRGPTSGHGPGGPDRVPRPRPGAGRWRPGRAGAARRSSTQAPRAR